MELVLVYLGSRIPLYLEKNLELLLYQFPLNPVVLLSDDLDEIKRIRLKLPNLKVVHVSNPEVSWTETLSASQFPQNFRENFWGKTLARFYSIHEYMSIEPKRPILHIEADIWISPNFPISKFYGLSESLAYPLTNHDQGVASTVYFGNLEAATLLKQFSESQMALDASTTDVSVLGALYKAYPDKILILPTAPSPDFTFHSFVDAETKKIMSAKYNRFGGIFDASTWGQFITGEDPRNNVGIKIVYHHQLHHSICPREVKFDFTPDFKLVAAQNAVEFEIFSLHVHSKNDEIFSKASSADTVRAYCSRYTGKETREFFFKIFMRQIIPFLVYRLRVTMKKLVKRA